MPNTAISRKFRREGFGRIELLVVLVVVAILAVLIVPVIFKSTSGHYRTKSMAFVMQVTRAAEAFKGANNGMYPGQSNSGLLKGSDPAGPYTGSQILAARLFGYPDSDIGSDAPKATHKYLEYKSYLLINKSSTGERIPNNSLGDDSRTINALLYFPSRLNATAPEDCYKWSDSGEYVKRTPVAAARKEFDDNCIRDKLLNTPNSARNPGGILIIGTGTNDMYLESDDNDDIKSWVTKTK